MGNQLNFPFGIISIHDNYVIGVMNEGATVTIDVNNAVLRIFDQYYKEKKFIYISHRLNSYAVDPNVYKRTAKIKNLAGIAIVSKNQMALKNAEIEKLFINIPFETFINLEEATQWAAKLIIH